MTVLTPSASAPPGAPWISWRCLHEGEEGGGAQRGDGEEEGEVGRGGRVEARELAADDGGHGPRGAGPEREALGEADEQRAPRRHLVEPLLARVLGATAPPELLDDHHHHAADDERARDGDGRHQHVFDPLVEGQADDDDGHEAEDERPEEPEARRVAGEDALHQRPEPRAVEDDERHDGAELHDDLERLGRVAAVPEVHAQEVEVPGRRDGEELRQAFEDAEDQGVEPGHRRGAWITASAASSHVSGAPRRSSIRCFLGMYAEGGAASTALPSAASLQQRKPTW